MIAAQIAAWNTEAVTLPSIQVLPASQATRHSSPVIRAQDRLSWETQGTPLQGHRLPPKATHNHPEAALVMLPAVVAGVVAHTVAAAVVVVAGHTSSLDLSS